MKRPVCALLLCAIVAVGAVNLSGQSTEQPRMGFLSIFKVGRSVNVKEVAGRFEVSTFDDLTLSHTITEVGPDHVTVEDISGLVETRIPIYSIKSFVKNKFPK